MICYMSKAGNYMLTGWNLDKDGALWITRVSGGSKKIAEGQEAQDIHNELCYMAETQFPCLLHHKGMFKTNLEGAE